MAEPERIGEILQTTPSLSINSLSGQMMSDICPHCGQKIKRVEVMIFGNRKFMPVVCPCVTKKLEEDEKAAKLEQRQRKIDELFHQSQLGPKFAKMTFKNFEQLPGTQIALKESVRFVKEHTWEKGEGLLIYGQPGNGKSHLAAAIIHSVISQGVSGLFLNVPWLITQIKATYKGQKYTEADFLYWVSEADVVALDDLGAENLTGNTHAIIYQIINSLNNQEKSLIVTTNLDVESELSERVGPRIYDRLFEMCRMVENKGWSYRRKIAAQRLEQSKETREEQT